MTAASVVAITIKVIVIVSSYWPVNQYHFKLITALNFEDSAVI